MTTQRTIYVKRGDSLKREISIKDGGEPVDITNWTIYFTVKKNKTDSDDDAVIKKDITTHTDPVNGKSYLLVLPSEMDNLVGTYYYDVQVKRPMTEPISYDDIETPLEGSIIFSVDITRRIA